MARDTVIVFGANRGLGEAIALDLAASGFTVAAVCRRDADAVAIASKIGASGGRALPLVTDFAAIEAVVKPGRDLGRGLAGIVNNAGVIDPIAPLSVTDPLAWARLI